MKSLKERVMMNLWMTLALFGVIICGSLLWHVVYALGDWIDPISNVYVQTLCLLLFIAVMELYGYGSAWVVNMAGKNKYFFSPLKGLVYLFVILLGTAVFICFLYTTWTTVLPLDESGDLLINAEGMPGMFSAILITVTAFVGFFLLAMYWIQDIYD